MREREREKKRKTKEGRDPGGKEMEVVVTAWKKMTVTAPACPWQTW